MSGNSRASRSLLRQISDDRQSRPRCATMVAMSDEKRGRLDSVSFHRCYTESSYNFRSKQMKKQANRRSQSNERRLTPKSPALRVLLSDLRERHSFVPSTTSECRNNLSLSSPSSSKQVMPGLGILQMIADNLCEIGDQLDMERDIFDFPSSGLTSLLALL